MKKILLLLILGIACLGGQRKQVVRYYDVFYLSVGSTHYINDTLDVGKSDLKSVFTNISGANKSARLVSEFLNKRNARGIFINSDEENYITKNKMLEGIKSIGRKIVVQKPKNPLLVFYYCGHGISETISGIRYLIPGNMTGDISKMRALEKDQAALGLNELYKSLEKIKVPFIIILDCCADKEVEYYEGLNQILGGTIGDDILTNIDIMKAYFDLKGDYPIVCSAALGESSNTVDEPFANSIKSIGPLCRRILITNKKPESTTVVSFLKKLKSLQDPTTVRPTLLCDEKLKKMPLNLW